MNRKRIRSYFKSEHILSNIINQKYSYFISMEKTITIFLIIAFLGNTLTVDDFPLFEDYIATYNKTYNATQLIARKAQYAIRLQVLISISDYTPAVNNFSDWYDDEISVLKGLKTPGTNSSETPPSETSSRPSSVDWTSTSVTTPKNQGYCGSCWAFAAVGYSESKLIIDGRYDNDIDLSEQVLLECTTDSSCNGGYLEYAFETVLEGIPIEQLFSYSPQSLYGDQICSFPGISIGKIDQNYYDLTDGELQELVAERPIAISLSANGWQNYGSGTFRCDVNDPINHAVLLVGYTPDYWLIKNSWGTNWGENGYIKVSKSPLFNCGIGNSAHRTFEIYSNGIAITLLLILGILFQ